MTDSGHLAELHAPSDAHGTVPGARLVPLRAKGTSLSCPRFGEARSAPASLEDPLAATGRPRGADSRARRATFLRLILEGTECGEAIKLARIKPERAAAILAEIARPLIEKAA